VHAIQQTIAEQAWTAGIVLPIRMEAWNARLHKVVSGPSASRDPGLHRRLNAPE
jgi:hypothetical protein